MKLSIIIPMYNSEKYIGNCLDSILNSDLPKEEYEVIVINDGSTDRGPEIVQAYSLRFSHFLYLTQENQGQSVARNYGIKESKGEYIWCVDSDDKVNHHLISIINTLQEHSNLDVVSFLMEGENESGDKLYEAKSQVECYKNKTGRLYIVGGDAPGSVCVLAIRKKIIIDNNLFFLPGITHQDVHFSYRIYAIAEHVMYIPTAAYIYIEHKGSTSKPVMLPQIIKFECDNVEIIKVFYALSDEYRTIDPIFSKEMKLRGQKYLLGLMHRMWINRVDWKKMGLTECLLKKLRHEHFFPMTGSFGSPARTIISRMLNIFFYFS